MEARNGFPISKTLLLSRNHECFSSDDKVDCGRFGDIPAEILRERRRVVRKYLSIMRGSRDGDVSKPAIEGVKVRAASEPKLETHLGITHGVAVLFTIVSD